MPPIRPATVMVTVLTFIAGALLSGSAPVPAQAAPSVRVTRVVAGLSIPWDLTWVGSLMLFDQRGGGVWSKRGTAAARKVTMSLPPIFRQSEAGMLGMVADPDASNNKIFYTCMAVATSSGGPKGVEVWKWRLTGDTGAVGVKKLITGIPLSSGRHSGCRLRFRSARMLYVGTGDAAQGTNAQNLKSLGGKVLRVRSDGSIPTTNPFYSRGGKARTSGATVTGTSKV